MEANATQELKKGRVYLVGAGPGDPGLITVKGQAALRLAEVVVYDFLVNPVLLNEVPASATKIFVGKRAGLPSMKQAEINALLTKFGDEGKIVVRLKGGDPFVFGRGGEEAAALKQAGIAFEIIPGVSSAIAVPAYAGIPVTHRDYASSFTVITGHEDAQRQPAQSRLDWQSLVRLGGTLVFLMGVSHLAEIANQLIAAGQPAHTPAALIEWGTWQRQRTIVGELHNLAELGQQAGIESPAITIIGEVVRLRPQLQWFDAPA